MVETKTAHYTQYVELHFTEKEKKDTNKKIKKISIEIKKDLEIKKSTTGSQCKPTRNKHGIIGNTIDLNC